MAGAACNQYDLDEVWFMPSNHPPHKEESDIVSNEHRQRMIQFAISCCKKNSVFQILNTAGRGTTYTSDTLSLLHESYPDTQFYFYHGEDSLRDFDSWHEPEQIAARCRILVCSREGRSLMELCEKNEPEIRICFFQPFTFLLPVYHPVISENSYRKAFFRMDNFHLRFFPI